MKFLIEKMEGIKAEWNKRPLTEDDFLRLCRRFKVTVQEMPLSVSGFYYCMKRRHFIAIDSKLPHDKKLFVMFHELAHFLMHVPDAGVTANFHGIGKRTRKEIEADAFALCAIVPRTWIENRSEQELIDEEGLTAEFLAPRIKIFQTYGF